MSAIVEGRAPPSRNVMIAKAESDNRERSLHWSPSQTSIPASSSVPPISAALSDPNGSSSFATRSAEDRIPYPSNGIINKDDLINSNPAAASSGSLLHLGGGGSLGGGGTEGGRASLGRERSSDSASKGGDDDRSDVTSGDGKKHARRRKANRACSHCQKAHLTCDDSRPCERCVKKGLADTCTDGARKKAKYLLDEEEILELKREKDLNKIDGRAQTELKLKHSVKREPSEATDRVATPAQWVSNQTMDILSPSHQVSFVDPITIAPVSLSEDSKSLNAVQEGMGTPSAHRNSETDLYTTISSFSPTSSSGLNHTFGSETTSLEYSILSSMLNGIDPAWLSGSPDDQGADSTLGRVLGNNSTTNNNGAFSHMGIDGMPWRLGNDETTSWRATTFQNNQSQVEPLHHMDPILTGDGVLPANGLTAYDALEVPSPVGPANSALSLNGRNDSMSTPSGRAELAGVKLTQNAIRAAAAAAAAAGQDKLPDAAWRERVKHIYSDQMKLFPYTEGYHFLIKYITANLEKAQVLRIVRALAIFRPSLIALQMPLTEEDEVFVERSLQRTILEFEKLVSFSGTPTVVWRRTCEVVVVGAEFSMLTQWSKEYLSGRYIYEFFDKPSILDYWEKFAVHAFENTAQSIMMHVTLKTSTGSTVKCAACFTIKRDVFDLPSLIVGNFLPILS
ncbi:hypothetical protein CBS101457_001866 [Exobasidium rhododendri]|nr:hypothetical protein CBS101457_001866 [Exobasidium rhododendri]